MKLVAASDRSLIAYLGDEIGEESHARVVALLRALERDRPAWLMNLHPGYGSLLVTFDPLTITHREVEESITRLERVAVAAPAAAPRTIEIPVCYGGEFGPDLEAVARAHALTHERVCEIHAAEIYRAYFLGFAPGFAYLGDVPVAIATPRHATPRKSVPSGSVGIAGRQTGVYPFATPGGWQLIGRTPLAMFRADRAEMNLIALGDRVRFRAISRAEFDSLAAREAAAPAGGNFSAPARGESSAPPPTRGESSAALGAGALRIEKPGMLTTVQDAGREGFGPLGVSPSGAADSFSLEIGNRILGNPAGAAALEFTLVGGTIAFPKGARIALAGSDFGAALSGPPLPCWEPREAAPGTVLEMGATRGGARCYLCVAGGVEVAPVMGSASTHLLSGLGGFEGRALRKGDTLAMGAPPSAPRWALAGRAALGAIAREAFDPPGALKILRVTDGPQAARFSSRAWSTFLESAFTVSEDSNRMGLRLDGPMIATRDAGEMISEGVSLGAIQATPGGQPIVLFIEQQTAGGYPKIANVIAADLWRLGQLRPRDRVRFERVSVEDALERLREQRARLEGALE